MPHTVKQTGSFSYTFTLTDASGTALDLTGYTVTSSGESRRNSSDTFNFGIVNTDLPSGKVTLTLTPTQTTNLEPTIYNFDIKATSGDTLTVYLTDTDTLTVKDNIS